MEYLLKCKQTQQSYRRPEAAMMNHNVKKEVHPSNSNPQESPEKGFFVAQRIAWIWTNPQLLQRTKKLQANQHGCSRQNWDQPGWVGGNTMAIGPFESSGPRRVQSTGTGALCTRGPPTTQHQRCWVNSIDSSSHNMNPVSLLAEKRQWWFHLSYISLFLIWSNEWSQYIKIPIFKTMFLHIAKHNLFYMRKLRKGEKAKTKWIILALGSCLLMLWTDLQVRRTHFHDYVSSYENYI